MFLAEFAHVLGLSRPKLVVCETKCLGFIQEALHKLGLNIPVFTFDRNNEDDVRSIDEWLLPTGAENEFR